MRSGEFRTLFLPLLPIPLEISIIYKWAGSRPQAFFSKPSFSRPLGTACMGPVGEDLGGPRGIKRFLILLS